MLKDRGIPLPLTMGHETAGEIIAVGQGEGRKVGEMVLVYPWIGCGECRVCRDGNENLCMKPRSLGRLLRRRLFRQIVAARAKYCLPIDGLDPVDAAPFACSGVTTYSALKKFGSAHQGRAGAHSGAGGLGLMCVSDPEGDWRQGRGRRGHRREPPRRGAGGRRASPRSTVGARCPGASTTGRSAVLAGPPSISLAALEQRRSASTRSPRAASSSWSDCSAAPRPGRCRSCP